MRAIFDRPSGPFSLLPVSIWCCHLQPDLECFSWLLFIFVPDLVPVLERWALFLHELWPHYRGLHGVSSVLCRRGKRWNRERSGSSWEEGIHSKADADVGEPELCLSCQGGACVTKQNDKTMPVKLQEEWFYWLSLIRISGFISLKLTVSIYCVNIVGIYPGRIRLESSWSHWKLPLFMCKFKLK